MEPGDTDVRIILFAVRRAPYLDRCRTVVLTQTPDGWTGTITELGAAPGHMHPKLAAMFAAVLGLNDPVAAAAD